MSQGNEVLDKSVSKVTVGCRQNSFLKSLEKEPLWSPTVHLY